MLTGVRVVLHGGDYHGGPYHPRFGVQVCLYARRVPVPHQQLLVVRTPARTYVRRMECSCLLVILLILVQLILILILQHRNCLYATRTKKPTYMK